ncbi:transposase, partial [Gluconobacter japonicus]|uniref:transposase n=1 Tax=Gluconobacter japonicus TaxID=376620 RepID=UPI0012E87137
DTCPKNGVHLSRGRPVKYDKRKYKRRNRIEIMFGRLKDWRRVATRYDRCPTVFFSAICLTVTVMFCLRGLSLRIRKCRLLYYYL